MGRIGITLLDVENAAIQLQGRGKNPTVDAIREVLGTGSKSTIAHYLKMWKSQQNDASGKLPHELLALVTGLWERLSLEAEQRIVEIEHACKQREQELNHSLYEINQNYADLKAKLHQSEELIASEYRTKNELKQKLQYFEQENIKLGEQHRAIKQQLQDSKDENNRLHQLATHVQANLEHYQNATQQLRTEKSLQLEKQQARYQQEITDLQRQVVQYRNQYQEHENLFKEKNIEFQQLQEKYNILLNTHDQLSQKNQENKNELIITNERCNQYQRQLQVQETKNSQQDDQLIELIKQTAVLTNQVNHLQKNLSGAEDKIESLRQEKLFLAQEKSHLEGYYKQYNAIKETA